MTESSKPLGMSDFFALEAGEYLERLDALLTTGEGPNADELVRLARALRGSALMANQHAIARTAAALEALARAVREERRAWDPQTQQLALRGVDDLKIFVRRAPAWSDADTAKAESLSQELEQLAGRPSAQVRPRKRWDSTRERGRSWPGKGRRSRAPWIGPPKRCAPTR